MTNQELYLLTYHKFKNFFITNLPSLIFISLIDDKDNLAKILNIDFQVEEFIAYLINKKENINHIKILKSLQDFLIERGETIEFRIFK